MRSLSRASIRHPGRVLAVTLLLTAAAAPGLLRLRLQTDGHALVPQSDPTVVYDRTVREGFGVRDAIAVVVRSSHPAGIFNPATLRRVRDLSADLGRLGGVESSGLMSLATEPGFRFVPGTLKLRTLLAPLPETPAAIRELRDDLRRIRTYDGTLVGAGGRATALLVGTPPGTDRTAFYHRVRDLAARRAGGLDRVEVLGAPVAEALLGSHILADLGLPPALLGEQGAGLLARHGLGLLPITLAVMALVFFAAYRHPVAVLLPLGTIGCCLVLVFGLMGWLRLPVYLTTVMLPVLLTAVGAANQVHIFRWYARLRRERPEQSPVERVRETMDEMTPALIQASMITAIGFFSFSFSSLRPVQAFGLFATFGVLAFFVASLTVVPAVLVLLRPALGGSRGLARAGEAGRGFFAAAARFAVRRRRAVLLGAVLLALIALDGVRRVRVQDSWLDGFARGSGFAQAMRRFDRDFLGTNILRVTLTAEPVRFIGTLEAPALGDHSMTVAPPPGTLPPGIGPERLAGSWVRVHRLPDASGARPPGLPDWSSWVESARRDGDRLVLGVPVRGGSPRFWFQPRDGERFGYEVQLEPLMVPATLRAIGGLEAFLTGRPGVGGVLGPAGTLETVGFMLAPDAPNDSSRRLPETPDQARARWSHYTRVQGPERLRQLAGPGFSQTLVTVFLKGSNYVDTGRLMAELREYERAHLQPQGLRLGFAGDVAVSQALIGAVVTTQVESLALSLAGILAVTALLTRSLRRGLYTVVPPALAILLDFAAMGWLGVPLGVATSMFAAMTLGIGADYSVHLLERFQRARTPGLSTEDALVRASAVIGPSIAVDALSVGLSFAVLLLSSVPATARLGGLVALSLFTCLAATLFVVPALVAARRPGAEKFEKFGAKQPLLLYRLPLARKTPQTSNAQATSRNSEGTS
jgi:predicted RND superfamily exporter protein